MRVLFALPIAVLFGCAHQSAEEQAAAQPPAANQATASAQPAAAAQPAPQPAAAQPAKPEPVAGAEASSSPNTCGLVRVNFDTDSAQLRDDDKVLLKTTAECLKNNQQLQVNVEGNTDIRGATDHNQQLGQRRAHAVSQYLETQGVSAQQLKLVNFGEHNPLCDQANADCWQKNRRTAVRPTCRM
jgi:outer membrane protein OmpA-like peptidoglycan-associated protein